MNKNDEGNYNLGPNAENLKTLFDLKDYDAKILDEEKSEALLSYIESNYYYRTFSFGSDSLGNNFYELVNHSGKFIDVYFNHREDFVMLVEHILGKKHIIERKIEFKTGELIDYIKANDQIHAVHAYDNFKTVLYLDDKNFKKQALRRFGSSMPDDLEFTDFISLADEPDVFKRIKKTIAYANQIKENINLERNENNSLKVKKK